MIPSRSETTSEFLCKSKADYFDISSGENSIKIMKKVQYQNHLRKLFLEGQQEGKKDAKKQQEVKLIHADWACKIPTTRLKFLPDFETLKKPGFGHIRKFSP